MESEQLIICQVELSQTRAVGSASTPFRLLRDIIATTQKNMNRRKHNSLSSNEDAIHQRGGIKRRYVVSALVSCMILPFWGLVLVSAPTVDGFSNHIIAKGRSTYRVDTGVQFGPSHAKQQYILNYGSQPKAIPAYVNGEDVSHTTGRTISRATAALTKLGMISFIVSMCLLLPLTLLPQRVLFQLGVLSRNRMNRWALLSSQWCARMAHRLIPFCSIETKAGSDITTNVEPTIWVCNHTSMLDVFILLIADKTLRGKQRRPIKIIYWKDLESNPVTKLLFRQAGFISVAMAANAPGEDNQYDAKSFKKLLKDSKQAIADGFDLGILPEGQLNPHPEQGILPIFTGAYTLAKFSKRKIGMMGLYNVQKLWGATRGMEVMDRHVKVQAFDRNVYDSPDQFTKAFTNIVGTFGRYGTSDRSMIRASNASASKPLSSTQDEDTA